MPAGSEGRAGVLYFIFNVWVCLLFNVVLYCAVMAFYREKAGIQMILLCIIILAVLIVLFLLLSAYERSHFIVREYLVQSEKIPSDFDGYTFAAMTDLHNNEFGRNNEKLIKAIEDIGPDAVLCGGDMLVAKGVKSLEVPVKLMTELAEKYKVYYCSGNHESRLFWKPEIYGEQGKQYFNALREAGIIVLNDKKITFKCSDGSIAITGLEIDRKYFHKLSDVKVEPDVMNEKLGRADKEAFNILMAHSPVSFDSYAKWGADLVLSGHFHGGTVVIPFIGGLMSSDLVPFPKYYRGRFDEYGSTMVVSGGLGTHSVNLRINNRPELIVIRLKKNI